MMTIEPTFQNILISHDDMVGPSDLTNLDVAAQDSAIMNFIEDIQRNSSDQNNCYLNDFDSMLS